MLLLTRNVSQAVVITVPPSDKEERITVVYRGNNTPTQVCLGFQADKRVNIAREELLNRKKEKGRDDDDDR